MPGSCDSVVRLGGLVTLNVGGKLYSTTLETLTRFPDSMLGAMFRGPQPALTDSRGNYFIDRDGKAFRHVLNFLRFGRLDLPEGYAELSLLRAEADFYQIRPLLEAVRQVEIERWRQRTNAVLHADVDLRHRRLHYNVRRGPQNYELDSCSLEIFTANVFCTDRHFLAILRRRLGQQTDVNQDPERVHIESTDSRPPSQDSVDVKPDSELWKQQPDRSITIDESRLIPDTSMDDDDDMMSGYSGSTVCHHLSFEWAPCPPQLPATEYAKQKLCPLVVSGGTEIRTTHQFLEEVLKVALAHGFRVDSVFPDPADILNARSLRFVRH
ncbi:BTB/POZ domain-containing protein KCTD11 [Anolis carolinensis]|uniref:BTB/POZ domain-containing protein KCTD11 n=1 Tax=Anolis carolinensis TaxID=28377 RepID=UPI002F2B8104